MTDSLKFTIIENIKCYSPKVASDYRDYPEIGFDITDKNAESSFWVSSRNRLFKKLVYANAPKKSKILEIGCGIGDFIKQISDDKNLEITGSEIYINGLKIAKKNLPHVELIQYDVSEGYINTKYNLILSFDVLEHIEKDEAALSNIEKMLAEDGRLILSVPQHMFLWSQLDELVRHKRRYSRKDLISKLKNNGFDIMYSTSFLFTLFPFMLIQRLFDKKLILTGDIKTEEHALEDRVKFSSALNFIFDAFMRVDEFLISLGISLPFGGTLVVVAKKSK
jgi:2-polyprenyl-3-methyl-5-hydroxy-6-metoxy-1,4-benzoquinol methylase